MLTLDSKVKALKKSPEATAIIVKYSPKSPSSRKTDHSTVKYPGPSI